MELPADQMLRSMLQFLALCDEEKLMFLPAINPLTSFMHNECGDRTNNPLFYYCSAAFELMDRYHGGRHDELCGLVADIKEMLSIMLWLQPQLPHIWYLDKKAYSVSGEGDRLWNVLRILAIQALSARAWPRVLPEIPFGETGWSGVRVPDACRSEESAE
jgi:hypothetical protein